MNRRAMSNSTTTMSLTSSKQSKRKKSMLTGIRASLNQAKSQLKEVGPLQKVCSESNVTKSTQNDDSTNDTSVTSSKKPVQGDKFEETWTTSDQAPTIRDFSTLTREDLEDLLRQKMLECEELQKYSKELEAKLSNKGALIDHTHSELTLDADELFIQEATNHSQAPSTVASTAYSITNLARELGDLQEENEKLAEQLVIKSANSGLGWNYTQLVIQKIAKGRAKKSNVSISHPDEEIESLLQKIALMKDENHIYNKSIQEVSMKMSGLLDV